MKILKNLFFILTTFALANIYGDIKPGNIRILLKKNVDHSLLEVCGPYYIFNPHDHSKISSGILDKRFIVRPISNGIKWGREFPEIHQILIAPRSKETKILLDGIQYDGAIIIYKIKNKINIINEIAIESYLKSILTTQFEYPLEPEAMAAVAIASRTTAYFQTLKNKNSYWDIDGEKIEYEGSALIINDSPIVKAVEETNNIILLNSGKPFCALWTEHSAGNIAPLESILRKDLNAPKEYIKTPHAALDKKESFWSFSIPIKKFNDIFKIEKIEEIKLFQEKESKKIYAIRIKEKDTIKDINFFTFQKKLGKENIKSNDFSVIIDENKIIFEGYGIGHGVGICLYSATAIAQNGKDAATILHKFYPNTNIVNISKSKKR
ncbi:MAG: hypothetical protein AMS24_05130 [Chlamydiae bacterium SM23_39]|nr:MAG: hypothetical protein AMS24_05130 [Chlamydiae bacterium SM23_39]